MQDLPAVPTIEVTLPSNYPSQVEYLFYLDIYLANKPICDLKDHTSSCVRTLMTEKSFQPPIYPTSSPDYLTTPFLTRVEEAFGSRLLRLPPQHTLTQVVMIKPNPLVKLDFQ